MKIYVGFTSGKIDDRFKKHIVSSRSKRRSDDCKFYRAIRKHGAENFWIEPVATFDRVSDGYLYEKSLIADLQSIENGYNTAFGGIDGMRKAWIIDGVEYCSKTQAAKAFDVPYQKMIKRLALGHTPEQAVGLCEMPVWKVGEVRVKGIKYASRADAARHYKLCPKTVGQRVNKLGWTIEQALGLEPPPTKKGRYDRRRPPR